MPSGASVVSASIASVNSVRICGNAKFSAVALLPQFFSGRSTFTPIARATSPVLSLEQSSTTMISSAGIVCSNTERIVSPMNFPSLYAGIKTVKLPTRFGGTSRFSRSLHSTGRTASSMLSSRPTRSDTPRDPAPPPLRAPPTRSPALSAVTIPITPSSVPSAAPTRNPAAVLILLFCSPNTRHTQTPNRLPGPTTAQTTNLSAHGSRHPTPSHHCFTSGEHLRPTPLHNDAPASFRCLKFSAKPRRAGEGGLVSGWVVPRTAAHTDTAWSTAFLGRPLGLHPLRNAVPQYPVGLFASRSDGSQYRLEPPKESNHHPPTPHKPHK